jgi:CMP-N-acetylneuraminic acid synthetase
MKNITAIIPVRKSDKILKGKNNLPFGKSTLLINKIDQLKKVKLIDQIIVSTDSEEYMSIALERGISVIRRPKKLSTISTKLPDLIEHLLENIDSKNLLWAPVVTPFIDSSDYENSINKYFTNLNKGYDSLISVIKLKRKILDSNGPLNFSFYKDLNDTNILLFQYINGITIAPKEKMKEWKYNWGKTPYKYVLDSLKGFEICNQTDYLMASSMNKLLDE